MLGASWTQTLLSSTYSRCGQSLLKTDASNALTIILQTLRLD